MKIVFRSLLLLVVVSALALLLYRASRGEFRCSEMPFNSLATPINEVDTSVFIDGRDVVNGGKAVVVRLVDANDREVYLVAVKPPNADFDSIIVNPPIEWGWDDRVGMVPDISIPANLYDPPEAYKTIEDVKGAVKDLIHVLKKYRDPKDRGIDIALKALER